MRPKKANFSLAGGALSLFIAFVLTVFGIGQAMTIQDIERNWVSVEALVTKKEAKEADIGEEFYVEYTYETIEGNIYTQEELVDRAVFNNTEINDPIKIYYDPTDHNKTAIDADFLRIGPFQIAVTTFFWLLGIVLLYWGKR